MWYFELCELSSLGDESIDVESYNAFIHGWNLKLEEEVDIFSLSESELSASSWQLYFSANNCSFFISLFISGIKHGKVLGSELETDDVPASVAVKTSGLLVGVT